MKTIAIDRSDPTLYEVKSVLVTSNWNRNGDVFDRAELWKARNTCVDQQMNLEHDTDVIVGHIASVTPVTMDMVPIHGEEVPTENFHLVTTSLIYKSIGERADALINEIEVGRKYVSMECLFSDFSFALEHYGDVHVIPRNEQTAFLTKHLRAYGGTGEFEQHKVGRVLRDIQFSGCGFVEKPANDNSVVLN